MIRSIILGGPKFKGASFLKTSLKIFLYKKEHEFFFGKCVPTLKRRICTQGVPKSILRELGNDIMMMERVPIFVYIQFTLPQSSKFYVKYYFSPNNFR